MGILSVLFGTTVITAVAAIFAITTNFLNIRDRFKKWKTEKKDKKKFSGNNPNFDFSLNYISDPQPRKCILHMRLINFSKEIKFINSLNYHFEDTNNPQKLEPLHLFMNAEKWPKRLEHGESFYVSTDFSMTLPNVAFQYWRKGFVVYCTCNSSTGDSLRSNSVDFDKLMEFMEPINENYKKLAILLSNKTGGSLRDIEVSLWELQIFKRLTIHIAKQLQFNNIPIFEYLISVQNLSPQKDSWYTDLEQRKIQPEIIEGFLKTLL
mgnify:CR=1 FL=1